MADLQRAVSEACSCDMPHELARPKLEGFEIELGASALHACCMAGHAPRATAWRMAAELSTPCYATQVERDGAREATRAAREAYQQCRAAYDERAAPVKELQQQRADAVSSATKLRESFRWAALAALLGAGL